MGGSCPLLARKRQPCRGYLRPQNQGKGTASSGPNHMKIGCGTCGTTMRKLLISLARNPLRKRGTIGTNTMKRKENFAEPFLRNPCIYQRYITPASRKRGAGAGAPGHASASPRVMCDEAQEANIGDWFCTGVTYQLVDRRPPQRKDGSDTNLNIWRGRCAECGEDFEHASPWDKGPTNRRCSAHAHPGKRAKS